MTAELPIFLSLDDNHDERVVMNELCSSGQPLASKGDGSINPSLLGNIT